VSTSFLPAVSHVPCFFPALECCSVFLDLVCSSEMSRHTHDRDVWGWFCFPMVSWLSLFVLLALFHCYFVVLYLFLPFWPGCLLSTWSSPLQHLSAVATSLCPPPPRGPLRSLCYTLPGLGVVAPFNFFCQLPSVRLCLCTVPFCYDIIPSNYLVMCITRSCHLFTAAHCLFISWFIKTAWFCGRILYIYFQ
jgi:hypothetical protein